MQDSTAKEKPLKDEAKDAAIVINGRRVTVSERELSFDRVVELSGQPTGPDIEFTISYRRGHGDKPEGSLVQGGEPVKVKEGMVFNADPTNRS